MNKDMHGLGSRLFRDKRSYSIVALVLISILLLIFLPLKPVKEIKLEDKCGKFINLVQHTIDSESACKTRCRSECESSSMEFVKGIFKQVENACNTCICQCR